MSSIPPKLILFIPQLFPPLKLWNQDFGFIPDTPILSSLLQTIDSRNTSSVGYERALFSTLGLPENLELPIAQYRYQGKDKELSHNQNHKLNNHHKWKTLICADPVHCEVGMNDITLTHSVDDLTAQESNELINQLNQHFAEDGLTFLLDANNHWYLAFTQKEVIRSSPLDDVRGKNIFPYLPESETRNWQQIHNEVQMLLHMSNLNQSREIAGLPAVNSLWFWGGGEEFLSTKLKFDTIYGGTHYNSTIGTSFAIASKSPWLDLPERGQEIINLVLANRQTENMDAIVILDHLIKPSILDDLDEWQQQVSAIEENYIKPLMDSWRKGQIRIEIDTCNGQSITPQKTPAWNAWFQKIVKQSPRPLFEIKL